MRDGYTKIPVESRAFQSNLPLSFQQRYMVLDPGLRHFMFPMLAAIKPCAWQGYESISTTKSRAVDQTVRKLLSIHNNTGTRSSTPLSYIDLYKNQHGNHYVRGEEVSFSILASLNYLTGLTCSQDGDGFDGMENKLA